ncbi:MAG: M67 family metallopeptidase [bacterium]|nr:M67 family metallopeptidase [bacterium]
MSDRVDLKAELESRSIPNDILHEICQHALDVVPEECCGLLLGDEEGWARRVVRITNVMTKMHVSDPEAFPRDARHAYYMSEVEYLKAVQEAEARSERVTAVYHSHVGHGCYLSPDDVAFATHPLFPFPEAAQIVVSLLDGKVKEAGVFEPRTTATGAPGFVGRFLEAVP